LRVNDRDAERVESTKKELEGNWDAHMKELKQNIDSTIDLGKKRKKQKGGLSFSISKQRRRRELKKKEESYIERRGTPSNLQNICGESKRGSLNWDLNLQRIEEEREDSDSPATSMAESEHNNSSNQSGSREETRDNLILTVSLILMIEDLETLETLGDNTNLRNE
jgi:hypothetical protein